MEKLADHHILVLGWPVQPKQAWLANYPFVTADRIYQEGLPRREKRWMNASFHAPQWLQGIKKLNPSHWYGAWRDHVAEYDTVIIIDEIRGRDVFEYILAHNPHCRLCVFYDSPIKPGSKRDPSHYRDLPIHFYTCDRKIAADYGLEFSPYFYIFSPYDFAEYDKMEARQEKTDVFFLGEEKGDRLAKLASLRELFGEAGLNHDLRLVRKRHGRRYTKAELAQTTDYMSYPEYIRHMQQSKAILELVSNGQTGITQRPYEALFFGKKLITTSEEVKKYPFYCAENVMILNEDKPAQAKELSQFINTPLKPVAEDIKEQFQFCAWLMRMLK
ncbi:hypothetical protein SAMN05216582_10793 [Selenomonas ruminantium]|uniref:Glycosyltransferase family 1 protein n=1 Tax=Selenomonas ruminantium TaxID=971 RepID=A0A1M6TET8_SELRU|nr:hypothetical protein [Selenomonas ruminantium]SHK55517.1 hypothetical protein SAMN05216582_10793 [Selenomonas ruminantium]